MDYKTGSIPNSHEQLHARAIQLPLYLLMLNAGQDRALSFYHYPLVMGAVGRKVWNRPSHEKLVEDAIAATRARLPEMAVLLRNGSFHPAPDDQARTCPYADLCGRLCAEGAVRDEAEDSSGEGSGE
jgi:RecB family exonuclease